MLRTAIPLAFRLGVSAYAWWLTQSKVLLMYLKLVVWPWPLLIHYQLPYLTTFAEAWMYVVPVALLARGYAWYCCGGISPVGFLRNLGIRDFFSDVR